MTEAKKKAVYDKSYANWLKFFKTEYKDYCDCSKLPLEAVKKVVSHIKAIFSVMKECGVCMYPENVKEPMEDVASIMLKFGTPGDPESIYDFMISTKTSCWRTVMFEKTPEEIEASARRSAQQDVEYAEWVEKQEVEKAEKADVSKTEDANEVAKKLDDSWRTAIESSLDDIRHGVDHWYADEHLTADELVAVKKYAATLFAFTEAQNNGMTGICLYQQNEARAAAHEKMLEVFGLSNNKYAEDITKSYDFSDDYDYKTNKYKHLDEDKVINMLGYALTEARKRKT